MVLYKNNTRYRSIVTDQVQSTENPKKALQIGSKAPQACEAELGFTDCDVGPGEIEVVRRRRLETGHGATTVQRHAQARSALLGGS